MPLRRHSITAPLAGTSLTNTRASHVKILMDRPGLSTWRRQSTFHTIATAALGELWEIVRGRHVEGEQAFSFKRNAFR